MTIRISRQTSVHAGDGPFNELLLEEEEEEEDDEEELLVFIAVEVDKGAVVEGLRGLAPLAGGPPVEEEEDAGPGRR